MAHNEPWQLFMENGQTIEGSSASREEFIDNPSLIVGAAHVWIWRRCNEQVEILLQKRAEDKSTWPGFIDISAAGHIDANETPIDAAVRETKEEVGFAVDATKLRYIFSLRRLIDQREFDTVYLYELDQASVFSLDDGEVESLQWVSLDVFKSMTEAPEAHKLVPQGDAYFSLVIDAIKKVI